MSVNKNDTSKWRDFESTANKINSSTFDFSNIKCNVSHLGDFLMNCSYIGFVLKSTNDTSKKGKI